MRCGSQRRWFVRWCYVLAMALVCGCVHAHDIITTNLTYSRDISRIFAAHCVSCHGAKTSIPLTNYSEVRPWAVDIKEQVLSRAMPPWGAVKGFGELAPDYGLSQEDILIIAAWVVGGAPEGNPQMLPKAGTAGETVVPQVKDAMVVESSARLQAPLRVVGIRPVVDAVISSVQVTAVLPDGEIKPLLWLFQFDPKMVDSRTHGVFTFRRPVELPEGTVVRSSGPLRFALECPVG